MSRIGYYTAASAIMSFQIGMDVTGNNIANVNTNGFKASRPDFADLIYTKRNIDETVHTGHGVKVDKTNLMFEQSELRDTGRGLDFAALDGGFFAVETTEGNIEYTKDGSFYANQEDGTLRDSNGGYVLGYDGNYITVPITDGSINYESLADMIGVYRFENPYGLDQKGLNYFTATASSGEAVSDETIKKKQGYVEASSTNIANEMSKVIEYQRAFQLNTNMVRLHNELEERINNLR
ncbi:MAG: flagellar hook-basal body protein [Oscillospiraceae bacterium]